jgi:hypothetical protein
MIITPAKPGRLNHHKEKLANTAAQSWITLACTTTSPTAILKPPPKQPQITTFTPMFNEAAKDEQILEGLSGRALESTLDVKVRCLMLILFIRTLVWLWSFSLTPSSSRKKQKPKLMMPYQINTQTARAETPTSCMTCLFTAAKNRDRAIKQLQSRDF